MVTSTLVNLPPYLIHEGLVVWKALRDQPDLRVEGLFWAEFDENDWRLFLATPLAASKGPRYVYSRLHEILQKPAEGHGRRRVDFISDLGLELSDIVVVNPEERIVKEMRRRYGSVADVPATPYQISVSPGEAYIYHLTKASRTKQLR